MIAILLGMLFGNIFKVRDGFQRDLDFTRGYILKLGIIFLGVFLTVHAQQLGVAKGADV